MDKFNGDWENRMLNEISSSTKEVENALKPVLNAKINSESATMDSMNYIEGQNMENSGTLGGESRGKVRVLRPNNNYANHDFNSNDYNNAPNMGANNYNSSSNTPSNPFFNTLGSAQTLILISTAVLVVLVFIVSFSIMKYIGI